MKSVSQNIFLFLVCSCVTQSDALHRRAPLGVFWLLHRSSSPPAGLGSGETAPPPVSGLGEHPSSGLHSGQPPQQIHTLFKHSCCSQKCKSVKEIMQNKSGTQAVSKINFSTQLTRRWKKKKARTINSLFCFTCSSFQYISSR